MNERNKIHMVIRDVPADSCEELVQKLHELIRPYPGSLDISVTRPFLWLSTKKGHFKLYYSKCRFVETDNRNLVFHYKDQLISKSGKISSMLKKLPGRIFFRCNNSYIVNLDYVSSIVPEGDRYNIRLTTGEVIPLSRSRYHEIRDRLDRL